MVRPPGAVVGATATRMIPQTDSGTGPTVKARKICVCSIGPLTHRASPTRIAPSELGWTDMSMAKFRVPIAIDAAVEDVGGCTEPMTPHWVKFGGSAALAGACIGPLSPAATSETRRTRAVSQRTLGLCGACGGMRI